MLNKNHLRLILKMISFTFLFFLICAFETSLWPTLFGSFPMPHIWLTLIVFIIINWPLYQGIFFVYFLGFILIFYTHAPLMMIWITLNLVYITIWTLKNRVNSSTILSFATLSAISSVLFSILYILISSVLETKPTRGFWLHRVTECGLVFLFSVPIYFIGNFLEYFFSAKESWNNPKATSAGDTP